MLSRKLEDSLREEHNITKFDRIVNFIAANKKRNVNQDQISAQLCYEGYIRSSSENNKCSKPYFLYCWLCERTRSSGDVGSLNMKIYKYFNQEIFSEGLSVGDVDFSKLSYRNFVQTYTSSSNISIDIDIYYESMFRTVINHEYPISMRSVFDRFSLESEQEYLVLIEGNLASIKSKPKIMTDDLVQIKKEKITKNSELFVYSKSSFAKADSRSTLVESYDYYQHKYILEKMSLLTRSHYNVHTDNSIHVFTIPNREVNFLQIKAWLIAKSIPYSWSDKEERIIVDNLLSTDQCIITNKILEAHRSYEMSTYEVYRLAGEKVLEFKVRSSETKEYLLNKLMRLFLELNKNIVESHIDPLELTANNIAKLRATNSLIFDSDYCRKAPPRVQPLVIREDEVKYALEMGKMVLKYCGRYYTTKDRDKSNGEDYIGMINKFGEYDPSRPYIPIIRTYKTNHLISTKFKELKAYLLRNSLDPHKGLISSDDILLPKHLEYLYSRYLFNPPPEAKTIHTKKTTSSLDTKTSTGEVPDYVRSILKVDNISRIINKAEGTGLLDACNLDKGQFVSYMISNLDKCPDSVGIEPNMVKLHINSGNVDHRIYGKFIENITGKSLIVFSTEGIIPYRFSVCEKEEYIILFLSNTGKYDIIVIKDSNFDPKVLQNIKSILRENLNSISVPPKLHVEREVDYTYVMLRVICYITKWARANNVNIKYEIIPEDSCKDYVESVYKCALYREGQTKSSSNDFSDLTVDRYKHYSKIRLSCMFLSQLFSSIIDYYPFNTIVVKSPIDYTNYNVWDLDIEDCLYYSVHCYKLLPDEEIQCLHILHEE